MHVIKSGLPRRPSLDHPLSPDSYPTFLPHITLASVPSSVPGLPDVLLEAIPENQRPIHAHFQSLVVGDHYFRSVFIDIEPTLELVDIQNQISTHLRHRGIEPDTPKRFPHMSLCYIADEDESERDRMARVLRDTGAVCRADTQAISLRCGEVSLMGFDGAEIWVVRCDGRVETWAVEERRVKL